MLHHHGVAGSPYTVSTTADAVAFSLPPPPAGPISFTSIQPPPTQLQPPGTSAFVELPIIDGSNGSVAANNLHDDDDMPADVGVSETSGAGASGSSGSTRWPREETLALIRIRTEMDAAFRNAPLKAPLWEDVARKLAALGYRRSAKKCKEKFENVDKYYRRTKEARAGRQDGKSYRFFSELEALHAAAPQRQQQAITMAQADPQPSGTMAWTTTAPAALIAPPEGGPILPDLSFSSMSGSSESDDEFDFDDAGEEEELGKRGDGECDREVMALFEGMMRQVTEKQDAMQRAFLETLERWEAERTAREEAWRRQEVARMNREREQLARERAAAASRDAALIAFLHRVGGGHAPPGAAAAVPAPPMPSTSPRQDAATSLLRVVPPLPPKSEKAWAAAGGTESGGGGSSTPSRWPKEEVQALIQLRTEKEEQYHHDVGGSNSKGPLWEDIAAGMRRIGYNRSAKRCKEKWENINKYFKKVKESNKRRPEDSKTCPYFHQLDAMYRRKRFAGKGAGTASGQASPSQRELEGKSSNDAAKQSIVGAANVLSPSGNSETAPTTTPVGDGAESSKKAEDTVIESNVQQQEFAADETDSDDMEGSYTDDGNDGDRMQYETGFQKPNVTGSIGNTPAPTETAAAATSSAPASSTFLDVQ